MRPYLLKTHQPVWVDLDTIQMIYEPEKKAVDYGKGQIASYSVCLRWQHAFQSERHQRWVTLQAEAVRSPNSRLIMSYEPMPCTLDEFADSLFKPFFDAWVNKPSPVIIPQPSPQR